MGEGGRESHSYFRRESGKLDHGGAGGAGPWSGDGEGVEKRPFQRQVSKRKRDHIFCGIGRGTSRLADSLSGLKPGKEGAESADIRERTLHLEMRKLKRQFAVCEVEESSLTHGYLGLYDGLRLRTKDLQRLRLMEEHEKRLQLELSICKKERNMLEGQVVQLVQELYLGEQGRKELELQLSDGARLSATCSLDPDVTSLLSMEGEDVMR